MLINSFTVADWCVVNIRRLPILGDFHRSFEFSVYFGKNPFSSSEATIFSLHLRFPFHRRQHSQNQNQEYNAMSYNFVAGWVNLTKSS